MITHQLLSSYLNLYSKRQPLNHIFLHCLWHACRPVHETAGNYYGSTQDVEYYRPKPQPRNEWSSGDNLPGPYSPSGDNLPDPYRTSGDRPAAHRQRPQPNVYPTQEPPVQYVDYQEQSPRFADYSEQPPMHPSAVSPTQSACK